MTVRAKARSDGARRTKLIATSSALRTLALETAGLEALAEALRGELASAFEQAIESIRNAHGRIIVSGMGKSGHIGRKIAATFASTGTPAYFVHPSEASHGDLGMITRDDVILALSWSGESVELANIINYAGRFRVTLIAVTSRPESALARASNVVLQLPRSKEACPHGLAPTTSTAMQLALGDCLAMALLETKGFTATDFKEFHPGGQLGANLKFVADLMHGVDRMPLVDQDTVTGEAIVTMTEKAFGCIGVVDKKDRLIGVVTDGDLRRHMGPRLLKARVADIMTKAPKTVTPETLATAALELLNSLKITALFVVSGKKPVGILHVHDLLRAGVA